MAIASSSALLRSFTHLPTSPLKHVSSSHTSLVFNSQINKHKRHLSLLASASSLSLPMNVDYLEREFSGHGVSFEGIGDSCVVKMTLENGSVASLLLPSGLITSYKPFMWHGTTVEVLQTTVSEGERGEVVIQGGVSMDFKFASDGGLAWSPSKWALGGVTGSSDNFIQVELVSAEPADMVEIKCLVTLWQDVLGSEFTIMNRRMSSLHMTGSVLSHLTVSTPEATYAVGLQGSNYFSKQPIKSNFRIIPKKSSTSSESWTLKALQGLFSSLSKTEELDDEAQSEDEWIESEGEEDDDYAQMTEKMCRIYTHAPRQFTIIDRGRRNSVVLRRSGFEEIYVFSPGSDHDWYGKYAYVCIGPSATLAPVVLAPGVVWRGAQYLYNPNL